MRSTPAGGLIAASIVASLLGGCAFLTVPVPWGHGAVRSGTMVPEAATRSLRVGETRRSEVLAQLGPPARHFEDLRIDAYGWADVSWYFPWLFAIGGGYGGWATGGMAERWQRHILVVRYDSNDRVERFGLRVCGGSETIGECARQWAAEESIVVDRTSEEPHAILYVWNPKRSWGWGTTVRVDGELAAELPPGTWTAIRTHPGLRIVSVQLIEMAVGLGGTHSCWGRSQSFTLRLAEGQSYEVEAGTYPNANDICPWIRWGVRRPADGVETRARLREVW